MPWRGLASVDDAPQVWSAIRHPLLEVVLAKGPSRSAALCHRDLGVAVNIAKHLALDDRTPNVQPADRLAAPSVPTLAKALSLQ